MNMLPPVIVQRPHGHPTFTEQTVCPALDFARVHLIKDKDGIDDYLAKNIKGLSKQEAAIVSVIIFEIVRFFFLCVCVCVCVCV
uniref:Uncharacterized protein n=1 Tax=Apteryx owenii TaxID=8824 RepID=A0A8B9NYA4_APTOW